MKTMWAVVSKPDAEVRNAAGVRGTGIGMRADFGMRLVVPDPDDLAVTYHEYRDGWIKILSPDPWPGSQEQGWIEYAHVTREGATQAPPPGAGLKVGKRYVIEVVEELP